MSSAPAGSWRGAVLQTFARQEAPAEPAHVGDCIELIHAVVGEDIPVPVLEQQATAADQQAADRSTTSCPPLLGVPVRNVSRAANERCPLG